MADTHEIVLKTKLDTSGIQSEIDRLNSARKSGGRGDQQASSAQKTANVLGRLEQTLSKLNQTLDRFAQSLRLGMTGTGSQQRTLAASVPPAAVGLSGMSSRQFKRILREGAKKNPTLLDQVIAQTSLTPEEEQVLRMRIGLPAGGVSGGGGGGASPSSSPEAPPSSPWSRVKRFLSNTGTADYPPGGTVSSASSDPYRETARKMTFRSTLRHWGVGSMIHLGSQVIGNASQLADEGSGARIWGQAGASIIGAAGAGAMTGAVFGPVGAGIGGALMGLTTAAVEVTGALKQLNREAEKLAEAGRSAFVSSSRRLDVINAKTADVGTLDREVQKLKGLEWQQKSLLQAVAEASVKPMKTASDRESFQRLQDSLNSTTEDLNAQQKVVDLLKERKNAIDDITEAWHRASQANMKAYREEKKRFEERQYRQQQAWHEASQDNIRAYRDEEKRYRERMESGRRHASSSLQQLDFRQQQQQIELGLWRGGTAAEQFEAAKWYRLQINGLSEQALQTDNPETLQELNRLIGDLEKLFDQSLTLGQMLKNLGSPLQRTTLGSLTSLASRGGWMGEHNQMTPWMKTLDTMADTLKDIERNTQEKERSVWQ